MNFTATLIMRKLVLFIACQSIQYYCLKGKLDYLSPRKTPFLKHCSAERRGVHIPLLQEKGGTCTPTPSPGNPGSLCFFLQLNTDSDSYKLFKHLKRSSHENIQGRYVLIIMIVPVPCNSMVSICCTVHYFLILSNT